MKETSFVQVDSRIVNLMQDLVIHRTRDSLTDRFGISYNTWRKLTAGEAIRRSVAERLTQTVLRLEEQIQEQT